MWTLEKLRKIQERERRSASPAEIERAEALGDLYGFWPCEECHGARFVGVRLSPGAPAIAVPCECMPLAERALHAGIPQRFAAATLDSFQGLRGKQAARNFAEGWDGKCSCVFWGDVGRGKSHLGCALLIMNIGMGLPARFVSVADFMDDLRARFDDDSREQSQAYFDRVAREPVLMLDDVGKEQETPWTRERLSTLIDRRYRSQATTIMTTNLTHQQIADRYGSHLADRLHEWTWVEVGGVSMRKEGAAA